MFRFYTINNNSHNEKIINDAQLRQAKFLNILKNVIPQEWKYYKNNNNRSEDFTTPTSAYEIASYLKPWHLYELKNKTDITLCSLIPYQCKDLQLGNYVDAALNIINTIDLSSNKNSENKMYNLWKKQIKKIKPKLFYACKETLNYGKLFYSSKSKKECIELNNFIYLLCIKDKYIKTVNEKIIRHILKRLTDTVIRFNDLNNDLSEEETIELFNVIKEVNLQDNFTNSMSSQEHKLYQMINHEALLSRL